MTAARRGLLDTSVFVAREAGRELDEKAVPSEVAISPVTTAELRVGVLAAGEPGVRAVRLATLESIADIKSLPIDDAVAAKWALLGAHLSEHGRRLNVNDLWIAATALAHGLPVVTQDDDFKPLTEVEGLEIILV